MSTYIMGGESGDDDHQYNDVGELFRPSKTARRSTDTDTDTQETATKRGSRSGKPGQTSAGLLEQVRASKNQAMEVLRAIAMENTLEHEITQYMSDVEASYNESDPRITFPKLRAAWTPEEDRLLMVGVRIYGPNTESWPRIAMLVPGRTNKSCRKRWFHSLDPSLHKGPWTQEEDDMLRQRVAQFPSQWSRVAEGIPGRTDDQCAKRWRESLDPEIERGKWKPEEDRLLLDKFSEFGTQWQKIATFFQGRPGLHCRNRWRKIQRIISQKERKSGGILSADDLSKTLASVTESVNRRKTAQRSRPQSQALRQTTTQAASAAAAADCGMTAAHAPCGDDEGEDAGFGQPTQQQQQQRLSFADVSGNDFSEDAMRALHYGRPPGAAMSGAASVAPNPLPLSASASASAMKGGENPAGELSGSVGALFMPSEQPAAAASLSSGVRRGRGATIREMIAVQTEPFRQQTAAKRTSSVLFSPTEEQRQRLYKLGRKLYGCAATPNTCSASFADPLSLNTHIKLAHPSIAGLIPSLSMSAGAASLAAAAAAGQSLGTMSSSPDTSNDDLMEILGGQHSNRLSAAAAAAESSGSKGGVPQLKPYRCAMSGCNHAYKNVNGLEYHIFHSRKSNNHLLPDPGQPTNDTSVSSFSVPLDGIGGASGAEKTTPLNVLLEGRFADTKTDMLPQIQNHPLQCSEVGCLATFDSEHELKKHVLGQHPRPIRRAVKPSNKVRGGGGAAAVSSSSLAMTPIESYSSQPTASTPVFWGATTISEMLSVAAGVGGGSDSPVHGTTVVGATPGAPMPTIPEAGNVPLLSPAAAADTIGRSLGSGNSLPHVHPGLGHRSFTGNLAT
ncbi:hypothetical protein GGH99_000156, partial [Coemansia sp. RSA 1285]